MAKATVDSRLGSNAWLLLAVGENRQHAGNDGYEDDPTAIYRWDSTVPHSEDLKVGDAIVLWDKRMSLGASVIEEISTGTQEKTIKKCPNCNRGSLRVRTTKTPVYRCFKCNEVFDTPVLITKQVKTFESRYDIAWVDLAAVLPGSTLRKLCKDTESQQSMRPLRWDAFRCAIEKAAMLPALDTVETSTERILSGHKSRTVRVRVGQHAFRKALVDQYGSVCAFTGPGPLATLEAGHLYSYAKFGEHHRDGGFLLRRDIHHLFDLGFLAVHPQSSTIDVHPELKNYPLYAVLHGQRVQVPVTQNQQQWLNEHWKAHRKPRSASV